jgi:hypothetical protein
MPQNLSLHIHTSTAMINAAVADLIHGRTGGQYFRVDERRKRGDDQAACTYIRPERLDDLFSSVIVSSRASVVDVTPHCNQTVLEYMRDRPGTCGDIGTCLITCTADSQSQLATVKSLEGLREGQMDPTRIRIVLSSLQADASAEDAFAVVQQFIREQMQSCTTVAVESRASRALEKASQVQAQIGLVMNHGVDFQMELDRARLLGATQDALQQLARKLLAQRMLDGARLDIERLFAQLSLPQISPSEWILEAQQSGLISQQKSPQPPDEGACLSPSPLTPVELASHQEQSGLPVGGD